MALKYLAGNRIQGLSTDRESESVYYSSTTENGSSQCNLSHAAYLWSMGRQVQSAEAGTTTTKISFYLKAPSATDYDLRAVVYTSGGSLRDTSNTVDASTLSTTGGWVEFDGLNVSLNENDYTMMEVFGSTNSNGVYVFRDGSVSGNAYETQHSYTNFSSHGTKLTIKYTGMSSSLTNLETGSIFEETDTGKHYIWNSSTSTLTEVA